MRCLELQQPVESKTRIHNGRFGSARRRAYSGAGRRWAEQGADISVALEANRPAGPAMHCKTVLNVFSQSRTKEIL